jgi:hypothetical protein
MVKARLAAYLAPALAVTGMGTFSPVAAQDQATLTAQLEEKLASEFVKLVPWFTDYDAARAESVRTGKPIFAYFSRSYAP